MCTTIATAWLPWQTWQYDSLAAWLHWEPWQFSCLNSNRLCWQLDYYDSLIALTAWMPWQLDCLDSSIALTARLLWQLDFLDSLNAFKLDCWNSLISLQYVPRMYMPVCRDAIASKNHSFYTQPIPIVLPKILEDTITIALPLSTYINILSLLVHSPKCQNSHHFHIQCEYKLKAAVVMLLGLRSQCSVGTHPEVNREKFADTLTCTHSEYQHTWQQFHRPLPQPTTQMREQPK